MIGKDKGKKYEYDVKTFELKEVESSPSEKDKYTSFIPVCTKNAFMKFYSPIPNNLSEWTIEDATYYKQDIAEVLQNFLD